MKPNIFVGDHSTVSMNLDHVEMVEAPPFRGGADFKVKVRFISSMFVDLQGANANMFMDAWERYGEISKTD